MPKWLDAAIERKLSEMGYVKARQRKIDVSTVFAGESPLFSGKFDAYAEGGKQAEQERLAVTSSWVFSNVRVIVNEASQAAVGVHEIKGEETAEVVDHEFERIMRRPNPHWSGALLKQYTFWWWLLRGEAYWLKVFDRTGALVQIWPLPASRMCPIPDKRKYISGYRYTPTNQTSERGVTFLPQQIVFFRFPNPFDYHRGLSPLSAYIRAMQTDIKAAEWNLDAFKKEMTLRLLISLRAELSQPTYEAAKAEIVDQLIEKQMRYMVARAGDVDVTPFSLTPKEAEYLGSREMSRNEIDRVFGFPEGYWSARANRSNSEAAKAALIDSVIWPLLTLMAADLTSQLIIPEYGEQFIAKFEDIRIVDRRLQMAERRVQWQVSAFDEARGDLNLEPYDGPMADIIGPLPVPLATNPQFVLALKASGGDGAKPQEKPPTPQLPPPKLQEEEVPAEEQVPEEEESPQERKAIRADLRRWRGIALRRLRNGEEPGGYEFESEVIPLATMAAIKALLMTAADEEAVEAAFKYNPAQPRDSGGRWTSGGGGAAAVETGAGERPTPSVTYSQAEPEKLVAGLQQLPEALSPFVTHYTAEEYRQQGVKVYISSSGRSGYGLKPDGDIISVFSLPGAREGKAALYSAIQNGGTKLDCFDGFLSQKFYPSFGFKSYDRWTWDDQYAPTGWDYDKHNRPNIVLMSLGG